MSAFDDLADLRPLGIWDGVLARMVDGDRVTLAVVELDPGSRVAEHSHDNEQLGLVVRGTVSFRVGDETRDLGPGGTWHIPPNAPHEVHAGPEGAIVIDAFGPARDDWASIERSEPQEPRWPDTR
ncbi:MAG: cupin domain-containing protein [Actinobacteria bacterium]|nr:cupin domain-containing protein [Actinomycetota bacterium]